MIRKWLLAAAAILGLASSPPAYSDTVVSGGRVVFGNDFFVNPAGPQGPTVHFKRPGNAQAWTTGSVIFATGPNELGEDNTRFFWNNTTKRLGIGMQPAYELDMRTTTGSSTVLRMGAGIGGHNRIVMGEGRTGNGYAYIDMVGDTTYTDYALRLLRDLSGPNAASFLSHRGTGSFYISTDQAGYLIFRTSGIDRMAIDPNSASVGIGLLPSYNLHVKVGVDQNLIVWSNGGLRTGIGSLNNAVNAWTPLSINPAGNVYISEGGGYVGIGTATPSYKVHVEGVVYSNNGYFITQGTSANYNFYDRDLGGGNSQIYRQSGISILWDSVAGNVISYTNGGLVGINTTTPLHALDIRAPGQDTYVYVGAGRAGSNGIWVGKSRASGNGFAYLDLVGDMTYTDYGLRVMRNQTGPDTTSQILHRGLGDLQLYTVEAAPISFVTNSAGRMWISAAGNIGIGTSAPRQKLEILGPNATIAMVDTASAVNNRVWDWIATASSMQGRLIDDPYAAGTVWVMASRSGMSVSTVVFPFGNVGVGTWNPSGGRLHVYSNDANGIMVAGSSKGLRMGNNPSNSFIEGVDNIGGGSTYQPLYISGANVTIGAYGGGTIYINPNGTMGIHTTRDLARLTFGSPTISDNIIHLWDDGTNRYGWGIRGGQKLDYAADNASLTWGHMSPAGVYTQRTAIDIYGNFLVSNGQFYSGYSMLNNEALEACTSRPSDGYCYVDLHTTPGSDFNFRMFRSAGANGDAQFLQTGVGPIWFSVNGYEVLRMGNGGNMSMGNALSAAKLTIPTYGANPALAVGDTIDAGNYAIVNINGTADVANHAQMAFIRAGTFVWQVGYIQNSNLLGFFPWNYSSNTPMLSLSPTKGITVGLTNVDATPGSGDQFGATVLLQGQDVSAIGFHDAGSRVDFIRLYGGTMNVCFNGGWGECNVALPGGGIWNNSGNVGIGTTTPDQRLQVNGGLHTNNLISNSGMDFYDRTDGSTGYSALYRSAGFTYFWNNTGAGAGYNTSGNFGFGTTSPCCRLHVQGADTVNLALFSGPSAGVRAGSMGSWGSLEAVNSSISAHAPLFIGGTHVLFGLNGVENARMDANGNWGLGYSSPGQKLAVNGNFYAASTIQSSSDFYGINLRLSGQYIFLGGAGGDVTNAGGPLIYGDGNYLIFKASGSNYNMQMREYNGGVRFEFGMNGQLIQNGYATVYADSGYVQISDTAGRKSLYLGNGSSYFRNYTLNFDNPDGTNFASASGAGWRFGVNSQHNNNRMVCGYESTNVTCRNMVNMGSDNTFYIGDGNNSFTQFNAGSTIHVSTTIMRVYAGSQFEVMNYNAYKNGGGSWLDNSDIRTKKEVFDYRVGLSEILRLRPVVYKHNGKYDTADNDERYVGFVADEVRKHMPEMVGFRYAKENPDSADYTKILTIDMTALPLALVNSVKELEARIKALETPGGRPTPN